MYTFSHKKKISFLSRFVKMYTIDQYFWLKITKTWTTKQSNIYFINYFSTFCLISTTASYKCTKLTDLACLVFMPK